MFKKNSIISLNISRSQLCRDLCKQFGRRLPWIYTGWKFQTPLINEKLGCHGQGIPQMSKSIYTLGPQWLHSYKNPFILTAGNVTLYRIIVFFFDFVDNFSAAKSKIQQQKICTSVQVSSFQTSKRRHFRGSSSWHGPGLWYSHSDFCFSYFQLLFSKWLALDWNVRVQRRMC